MSSRSSDLIKRAIALYSSPPTCKKAKLATIDECIAKSTRKALSTDIDYAERVQGTAEESEQTPDFKYQTLKSGPKQKRKKKKKLINGENSNSNQLPMKNTELNGQNLSLPTPKNIIFAPEDVQLGWKSSIPVGSGFTNLGTTCYINSTLQALFHVPSFVNWLHYDTKHDQHCEKMNGQLHSECLVCAMKKMLFLSLRATGGNIKPKYIIDRIKTICKHLSPFRQEDAHEFLRYLMEAMEKSYITALGIVTKKLDSYSKETTPLNQIFGGYIRTEVTCLECSHVSTTFQHFQDLILDIRQNNTTNVYDGLESYFSKERLDGDEAYHCEHCKKKVSAYKKFSIERTPNVLCIQLKRFNINSYYGGSKISKIINTPQTIDLSKFKHRKGTSIVKPLKYRLVSMVFHHGSSANSGHYTALGCTSSGSYYYFNDEHLYPVHLQNYTNNPNAYIMFYEREKPNLINESKMSLVKSAAGNSTSIPLTNGCANGTVQPRPNGLFAKRESQFSNATAPAHPKYLPVAKEPITTASSKESDNTPKPAVLRQSWIPVDNGGSTSSSNSNNKENDSSKGSQSQPVKSAIVTPATPVLKTKSTSLVPYTPSSDSENSDVEPEKASTDASDEKSGSTLSPLAKKNSTLTSLLTSSPKNESAAYRVAPSSSRPLVNGTASKNDEKTSTVVTALQNGNHGGEIKPSEERSPISFSLSNRERKKADLSSSSSTENGTSTHYNNARSNNETAKEGGNDSENGAPNEEGKKNGETTNGGGGRRITSTSYGPGLRENGLMNGVTKTNGMVNGDRVKAMNGWTVTTVAEECNTTIDEENSKTNGDWTVTEKENRKMLMKDSVAKQKDNRKCNGSSNGNEIKHEMKSSNYTPQKDPQSSAPHNHNNMYSSQNGYGGRVHTWNGELSSINKETDQERREANKRKYSIDYEEDIDRGKVKKSKYYRNENCSTSQPASPHKNLIQQHYNQYNNLNGGKNQNVYNSNNNRGNGRNKWQFPQNGFNYNHQNRRGHNGHYRNNNYYNNNHHHHRNGGYSNGWRR